jgi:hypothetical protein
MRQIQENSLRKIAALTELGAIKWLKRPDDDLRWVKEDGIRLLISMNPDMECLLAEFGSSSMIVRGGVPIVREAVRKAEALQ